jgi:hypothetical protein
MSWCVKVHAPGSRFRLNVSAGSQKTAIHSEPEGTSVGVLGLERL